MTLSQWLDTWLNEYSGDKKYLTVKGYKAQCSKHIKPLTDEQVAALLKVADNDLEYGSIIKLTVLTGLRECEALGLTWDCVDFEKGCITVNKQLQKLPRSAGGFAFAPLKNDKVRVIKPAPFVIDLLKTRYCEQAAQRLSAAEAWTGWQNEKERRNYLVFTTLTGAHLGPNTFYNHFKKLAAQNI